MPEEIILEDGSKREVLTDDEVKNLKAGHDANTEKRPIVEQHNKVIESLELKEGQTVEERLQEMKDAESGNWRKMRNVIDNLKADAKKNGKEIDDEGKIVEKSEGVTEEQVKDIAKETALEIETNKRKEDALSKFDKKDADNIGAMFDKINIPGATFEKKMELAIDAILPGQDHNDLEKVINTPGGGGPTTPSVGKASSDLKEFGKQFGLNDKDFENAEK